MVLPPGSSRFFFFSLFFRRICNPRHLTPVPRRNHTLSLQFPQSGSIVTFLTSSFIPLNSSTYPRSSRKHFSLSCLCCRSMRYYGTDSPQRERSRSPRRRSRSPRRNRRSYSPRSRSRSRDDYHRSDRRSRSPLSATGGASGAHSGSAYGGRDSYGPPPRFEERAVAKEHMMQNVRDSSQQDRRVYVGNLSYDVKWHHLKDFMRQGEQGSLSLSLSSSPSLSPS